MLPTTFEFRWDAGHMIFFGLFYAVVVVIFTSLSYVVIKSMVDAYRAMRISQQQADDPGATEELAHNVPEAVAKT